MDKLKIHYIDPKLLTPRPGNPRTHSAAQIAKIVQSIKTYGFLAPVLTDGEHGIVVGHGRTLAAIKAGLTEIPTVSVAHLSAAQIRTYVIADNKLAEEAGWNAELLAIEFKELESLEVDLTLTGFEIPEIDLIIQGAEAPKPDRSDAFEVPEGPVVSRLGDVWLLDQHKIICGNALDQTAYEKLFAGDKAGMVFSDPPYNVPIAGHAVRAPKRAYREFPMAVGEMSPEDYRGFLSKSMQLSAAKSAEGALQFVCIDWRHLQEILRAGEEASLSLLNLCVWVKSNGGMGSLYRSQHELVLVYRHGDASHINNVRLGRFGRNRTNVWNYANPTIFGKPNTSSDLAGAHPTPKPVAMIADAILDASHRGDVVLDPFLGSGSTLIASEQTGRKCFGIELDTLYVDVAIRRWMNLSGKDARHENGRSFTAMETERKLDHA